MASKDSEWGVLHLQKNIEYDNDKAPYESSPTKFPSVSI